MQKLNRCSCIKFIPNFPMKRSNNAPVEALWIQIDHTIAVFVHNPRFQIDLVSIAYSKNNNNNLPHSCGI